VDIELAHYRAGIAYREQTDGASKLILIKNNRAPSALIVALGAKKKRDVRLGVKVGFGAGNDGTGEQYAWHFARALKR
jgi:hypothetical protein